MKFGGDFLKFNEKLELLQRERAETNYRLAKSIGVHQSTIKNWKDGKKPQLAHRAALAKHYECTIDELFGGDC